MVASCDLPRRLNQIGPWAYLDGDQMNLSLAQARASGATRYQSDHPCKNGHQNPERFTATQGCVECHRSLVSFSHYQNKGVDPMISVNEQLAALEAQVEQLKDHLGREPAPPPKRIPAWRNASQAFSVARLVGGKIGRTFDGGFTKVSVVEHARKMAAQHGCPIRFLAWDVDLNNVTGPDAICIIERIHCTDSEGGSGRVPVSAPWPFSNKPPAWLKFGNSEVMA
jgi:hypothetical protein